MVHEQCNNTEKVYKVTEIVPEYNLEAVNLHSELGFALWIRSYLFVSPNQNLDEYEFCEGQNETCGFDVDTLLDAVKELNADAKLINFI